MRTVLALVAAALALGAVAAVTAAPPTPATIDEAVQMIDRAADHVVAQHLAQPLGMPAGALEAQRRDTGLTWGEMVVAHRLARTADLTFEAVVVEKRRAGATWDAIAQGHGVQVALVPGGMTQALYALDTEPSRASSHTAAPDAGASPGRAGGGGGYGGRRR
jgi:hypothetical protein